MSLWRLFLAVFWTLGAFIGDLISGAPIGEVVLVTAFFAFITGLVHLGCAWIVQRTKYRL